MKDNKKETNQVYSVVEEDIVIDKNRLTWNRFVDHCLRYKYWISGFSILGLIAGFFGTDLIINDNRMRFSSSFTLTINNPDKTTEIPGQSAFNFYDLISKENILKLNDNIRENDVELDLDKIISEGDITIQEYVNSNNEKVPYSYTISGKSSAFNSDDEIEIFLNRLLSEDVSNIFSSSDNEVSSDIVSYNDTLINLYKAENAFYGAYRIIETNIDKSITLSTNNMTVEDYLNSIQSEFLFQKQQFVNPVMFTYVTSNASKELSNLLNAYYLGDSTKSENFAFVEKENENIDKFIADTNAKLDTLKNQKEAAETEKTNLNEQLNSVTADEATSESILYIVKAIKDCDDKIASYDLQINFYEAQITNISRATESENVTDNAEYYKNKANFTTNLANYITKLNQANEVMSSVMSELALNGSFINYLKSNVYEIDGGINPLIGMIGGFVAFFVLSAVVAGIVGQYKLRHVTNKVDENKLPFKEEPLEEVLTLQDKNQKVIESEEEKSEDFDPNKPMFK